MNSTVKCTHPPCCCVTTLPWDNRVKVAQNIGLVRNVLSCKGVIHLGLEYFQSVANFYRPLASEKLGIHKGSDVDSQLSTWHTVLLSQSQWKMCSAAIQGCLCRDTCHNHISVVIITYQLLTNVHSCSTNFQHLYDCLRVIIFLLDCGFIRASCLHE